MRFYYENEMEDLCVLFGVTNEVDVDTSDYAD